MGTHRVVLLTNTLDERSSPLLIKSVQSLAVNNKCNVQHETMSKTSKNGHNNGIMRIIRQKSSTIVQLNQPLENFRGGLPTPSEPAESYDGSVWDEVEEVELFEGPNMTTTRDSSHAPSAVEMESEDQDPLQLPGFPGIQKARLDSQIRDLPNSRLREGRETYVLKNPTGLSESEGRLKVVKLTAGDGQSVRCDLSMEKGRSLYHCKICTYKTYSPREMINHFQQAHVAPEVATFNCPHCVCMFKDKKIYLEHLRKMHNKPSSAPKKQSSPIVPITPNTSKTDAATAALSRSSTSSQGLYYRLSIPDLKKIVFKCTMCEFEAKEIIQVREHYVNSHSHMADTFMCELCPSAFNSSSDLAVHIRRAHPENTKIVTSNFVGKEQWQDFFDANQINNTKVYSCKFCSHVAKSEESCSKHIDEMHPKNFQCSHCSSKFYTEEKLSRHITDVHQNEQQSTSEAAENNRRRHTTNSDMPILSPQQQQPRGLKNNGNVCDDEPVFAHRTSKSLPLVKKKSAEKSFKCQWENCFYEAKSLSSIRNHQIKAHNRNHKFGCHLCSTRYSTQIGVNRHISRTHVKEAHVGQQAAETSVRNDVKIPESESMDVVENEDVAQDDDNVNDGKEDNNDDVNDENEDNTDDAVDDRKGDNNNDDPMKEGESAEEPPGDGIYRCKFCDLTTTSKPGYITHLNASHSYKNEFECMQCPCRFQTKAGLKLHVYKAHNQKKSPEGKSRTPLKRGRKKGWNASSENGPTCDQCSVIFKTSNALTTHLLRVHSTTVDGNNPTFTCDICGYYFHTLHGVTLHKSKSHGRKSSVTPASQKKEMAKNNSDEQINGNSETSDRSSEVNDDDVDVSVEGNPRKRKVSAEDEENKPASPIVNIPIMVESVDPSVSLSNRRKSGTNTLKASNEMDEKRAKVDVPTTTEVNTEKTHERGVSMTKAPETTTSDPNVPTTVRTAAMKEFIRSTCSRCSLGFDSRIQLKDHFQACDKFGSEFPCKICNLAHSSLHGLKLHIWGTHMSSIEKTKCEETTISANGMASKVYTCYLCQAQLMNRHIYTIHMSLPHLFRCKRKGCAFVCNTRPSLINHKREVHKKGSDDVVIVFEALGPPKQKNGQRMNKQHKQVPIANGSGPLLDNYSAMEADESLVCQDCGYISESIEDARNHNAAGDNLLCCICGHAANNSCELALHEKTHDEQNEDAEMSQSPEENEDAEMSQSPEENEDAEMSQSPEENGQIENNVIQNIQFEYAETEVIDDSGSFVTCDLSELPVMEVRGDGTVGTAIF